MLKVARTARVCHPTPLAACLAPKCLREADSQKSFDAQFCFSTKTLFASLMLVFGSKCDLTYRPDRMLENPVVERWCKLGIISVFFGGREAFNTCRRVHKPYDNTHQDAS